MNNTFNTTDHAAVLAHVESIIQQAKTTYETTVAHRSVAMFEVGLSITSGWVGLDFSDDAGKFANTKDGSQGTFTPSGRSSQAGWAINRKEQDADLLITLSDAHEAAGGVQVFTLDCIDFNQPLTSTERVRFSATWALSNGERIGLSLTSLNGDFVQFVEAYAAGALTADPASLIVKGNRPKTDRTGGGTSTAKATKEQATPKAFSFGARI
jgi:hypothetical protein